MSMRAASYERTGPASVLRLQRLDRPEPGPGEVRVRVRLSAINPTDTKIRSGATALPIDGFQVPHQDGTGIIDAVGADVDQGRVGQRVWIWFAAAGNRWGTAAEWTVVPAERAVPLPDGVPDEVGACLGVPALTAHYCIFTDGPVTGRTVLVQGGAGSVGHFAVELAKWAGARVATTVSSPEKADLARQAGADLVVNYRQENVVERVRAFAPQVHRIVEVALVDNLDTDLQLADAATTVVCYATDGRNLDLPLRRAMGSCVTFRFMLLYTVPAASIARATEDLTTALTANALSALPIHRFSLDQVVEAHEAVEAGETAKCVIGFED